MTGTRRDARPEAARLRIELAPEPPPVAATTTAPPSRPMAVARGLVTARYTVANQVVLRNYRGDFYRWNGQCWPAVDQRDVRAQAYEFLEHARYRDPKRGTVEPFAPSRRKIDDVIDALRAVVLLNSTAAAPTWMDGRAADPPAAAVIAMTNGLLDVRTRTLQPHTPQFFTHHALPFAFEPHAVPRAWLQFLGQLWDDDASSIAALQEALGYLLAGGTQLQKMFLMVGPKRAGKGTIGRVLTGLLGPHNVAAPTLASLSTNFGLAALIGRPLALVSDARLGKTDSIVVERLLSVSGEDSLTIDRKFKEPWTGRLPTRFLILTNELPRLSDSSGALASRFMLFVLTKSFYGIERPQLTDDLLAEAPAILNWALVGLDRLNARGHFLHPDSGKDAIQQLEDLSSPISAFIRDRCVVAARHHVKVDALWIAWKHWCEADNRPPGTKAVFGRDLRASVPTLKRVRLREGEDERDYAYEGIGLGADDNRPDLGPLGPSPSDGPGGPSGPSNPPLHSHSEAFDPAGAFGPRRGGE